MSFCLRDYPPTSPTTSTWKNNRKCIALHGDVTRSIHQANGGVMQHPYGLVHTVCSDCNALLWNSSTRCSAACHPSVYLKTYFRDAEEQLKRWLQMYCPAPALRDKELLLLLQQLLQNAPNIYLQSSLNMSSLLQELLLKISELQITQINVQMGNTLGG